MAAVPKHVKLQALKKPSKESDYNFTDYCAYATEKLKLLNKHRGKRDIDYLPRRNKLHSIEIELKRPQWTSQVPRMNSVQLSRGALSDAELTPGFAKEVARCDLKNSPSQTQKAKEEDFDIVAVEISPKDLLNKTVGDEPAATHTNATTLASSSE